MFRRLVFTLSLFLALAVANTAEATCLGDWWGARAVSAISMQRLEVTMTGTTSLHHTENHVSCSGDLSVRAELWGGATCNSNTVTKTHEWFGENDRVETTWTCGNLYTDVAYTAHGIHTGFGEQTTSYQDPPFLWSSSAGGGEPGGVPEPQYSGSPIIVDLAHNGFDLTSLRSGVRFDLDADGFKEEVSWTAAASDDSFLALDRSGNGQIDSGAELFGNYTPPLLANGFEALKIFDADNNGVIDQSDPVYAQLLLWTDSNHDGLSEPNELRSLSSSGILAIRLDYKTSNRRDAHGNLFSQRAKAVWPTKEAYIYDVWLMMR